RCDRAQFLQCPPEKAVVPGRQPTAGKSRDHSKLRRTKGSANRFRCELKWIFRPPVDGLAAAPGLDARFQASRPDREPGAAPIDRSQAEAQMHGSCPSRTAGCA